jgi:hypothetical protein
MTFKVGDLVTVGEYFRKMGLAYSGTVGTIASVPQNADLFYLVEFPDGLPEYQGSTNGIFLEDELAPATVAQLIDDDLPEGLK